MSVMGCSADSVHSSPHGMGTCLGGLVHPIGAQVVEILLFTKLDPVPACPGLRRSAWFCKRCFLQGRSYLEEWVSYAVVQRSVSISELQKWKFMFLKYPHPFHLRKGSRVGEKGENAGDKNELEVEYFYSLRRFPWLFSYSFKNL